jgi:hypothetical protein
MFGVSVAHMNCNGISPNPFIKACPNLDITIWETIHHLLYLCQIFLKALLKLKSTMMQQLLDLLIGRRNPVESWRGFISRIHHESYHRTHFTNAYHWYLMTIHTNFFFSFFAKPRLEVDLSMEKVNNTTFHDHAIVIFIKMF